MLISKWQTLAQTRKNDSSIQGKEDIAMFLLQGMYLYIYYKKLTKISIKQGK